MCAKPKKQTPYWQKFRELLSRNPKNKSEVSNVLHNAERNNLIDTDSLAMLERVLRIPELQCCDIMIPRSQMVIIDINASLQDCINIITESGHSRFPVVDEDRDKIIGVLLAKDLLKPEVQTNFNLKNLLRPALFIPESKHLKGLLKELRLSGNHMAIVADEYGGVAGLITIEDILEEIVGEIEDEYDIEEEQYISKIDDQHYTVKAMVLISEFNEYFKSELDDSEFDTIAGLITQKLGFLPKRGDTVKIDQFNFKVLHADNRRVRLLSMQIEEQ